MAGEWFFFESCSGRSVQVGHTTTTCGAPVQGHQGRYEEQVPSRTFPNDDSDGWCPLQKGRNRLYPESGRAPLIVRIR